jgi:hypothetical protein
MRIREGNRNDMQTLLTMSAVPGAGLPAFLALRRLRGAQRRGNRWSAFAAIVLLNFVVFWWVGVLYGGDALSGKVVGDHWFLGEHGRYTEVSRAFWAYSYTHAVLTILSFAALFVSWAIGIVTGRVEPPSDGGDLHPRGRGNV